MKLGVFTPVFGKQTLDQVLAKLRSLPGVSAIEIATGAWPGSDHIDVDSLLASPQKAADFGKRIRDAGLTISALSCHGNPMHPNRAMMREHDDAYRKSVRLAKLLQVPVLVTFSGCPGDGEEGKCPNWIVAPWPPEFLGTLEWQGGSRAIACWNESGRLPRGSGVTIG